MENKFKTLFDLLCLGNKKTFEILKDIPIDILIKYMDDDLKENYENRSNSSHYIAFVKEVSQNQKFNEFIEDFTTLSNLINSNTI